MDAGRRVEVATDKSHIKAIAIVCATMEKNTEVLSFKDQEKEKEQERPWCDLPLDLLSLIISNLFAGDCSAFNMVCKSWRPITPAIRPLPPPIGSPHCQSPCLLFFQRSSHKCKLFHPLYNDFYHMELPEILDAKMRFSKYGWLLMSREDLSVFFFNLSTKVTIELPKMPSPFGFATMCFTSPPTSLDCAVVGFNGIGIIEISIIRRGEDSWTTHEFSKTREEFYFSDCNPVFHKRMFYCLGVNGNVGIFDPRDDARRRWTIPVKCLTHCGPDLPDKLGLPKQSFLVKIGGVISAVFVAHEERQEASSEERKIQVCMNV
ncbi:unnamed protein product [Ilex paraguariensis]|uniref:KIB1-4 beta-propeller domain-containing protein n=1 Tax=Ilex paraguariensis TaxID=185542 RepID=A0ABC8TD19_9AQUA